MADMPVARRMRRFRGNSGTQYDELPDGQLRRRLKSDDPAPIPMPQGRDQIEQEDGPLVEMSPALLATPTGKRPLPPIRRNAGKK